MRVSEAYSAVASLSLLDTSGTKLVLQPCAMIVVAVFHHDEPGFRSSNRKQDL